MSNSKYKKIIYVLGICLFLNLIFFRFVQAQECSQFFNDPEKCISAGCGYNGNTNECVPCSQFNNDKTDCESSGCKYNEDTGECYSETAAKKAPTTTTGCGVDPICWLKVIANFFLNLPLAIFSFIVVIASLAFAALGEALTFAFGNIAGGIISLSLDASVRYLDTLKNVYEAIRNGALWFFAVFLALIGLTTIFRIESYWAKKTLVPLLVVALLFNFIPFIVKTIVSIGNSLSCWTLNATGGSLITCSHAEGKTKVTLDLGKLLGGVVTAFINFVNGQRNYLLSMLTSPDIGETLATGMGIVGGAIVYAIFWFALALALILLALTFLLRMVYIWLLFLAAPIAFATFAFRTKEIQAAFPGPLNWEGWIKDILHWSFAAVLIAFWIGIASTLITNPIFKLAENPPAQTALNTAAQDPLDPPTENSSTSSEPIAKTSFALEAFKNIMPYVAALIALYLGMSATPEIMKGITGGALKALGAAGTAVAIGSLGAAKAVGKWGLEKVAQWRPSLAETAKRYAERLESIGPARAALKPMEETLKGVPFAGIIAGKTPEEKERKAIQERYEKMSNEDIEKELKSPWTSRDYQMVGLETLAKRGKIDEKIAQKFFAGKTLEQIQKEYGTEVAKSLKTKRPDLLTYVINPKTGKGYKMEEIPGEFLSKMSPKDVVNLSDDALKHPEIAGWIAERPAFASALIRRGKESQKIAFYEGFLTHLDKEAGMMGIPTKSWRTYGDKIKEGLSDRDALRKAIDEEFNSLETFLDELEKTSKEKSAAYRRLLDSIMLYK